LQYVAIVFLKLSRKKYLSAACLLAYANLLQKEKEKGKKTKRKKKPKKQNKTKKQKNKKQTHESNKDWVPWG